MDSLLSIVVLFPLAIGFFSGSSYILVIPLSISALVCYIWAVNKLVPSRLKSPPLSGYGLIQVYPPIVREAASRVAGEQDRTVDLLFVHGLGANPDTTWCAGAVTGASPELSTKSCCWITDLLPDDLKAEGLNKHVRLFTFNYDSFWMREANSTRLAELGRILLQELLNGKVQQNHIVFVGHSYGGLVIKQALVLCSSQDKDALTKRINGILFLGTPHRGTTFTKYGRLAGAVFSPLDSNTAILTPLIYDSDSLLDLQSRFISEYPSIQCVYFYEKHKMRRYLFGFIPWLQEYVVNEASATANAKDMDKVPLETGHSGLNKFISREDGNYARVLRRLIVAVKRGMPLQTEEVEPRNLTRDQQACLKSLAFPEMELRQHDVDTAAENTCEWLVRHPRYQAWRSGRQGLLWVKGKPGAGKSTLLKYALQNIEQQSSQRELVVASFFFSGRGSNIQKTPLGLFRSLLHQLSSRVPALLDKMTSDFTKKCVTKGEPGTKWQWHENELKDLVKAFLRGSSTDYNIRIYVDALDECGEDTAVDLLEYFQELVSTPLPSQASFSICFSCRHYPIIVSDFQGLEVCVEHENHKDIENFVRTKLEYRIFDISKAESLKDEIVERADGVFQWVVIVVLRVVDLHKRGIVNLDTLLRKIRETPRELHNLYQEALAGISAEDHSQSLQLMQWICFAFRPLSLQELRFAMAVDLDTPYGSLHECQQATEYVETDESMEQRVMDLSKGLAEVRKRRLGKSIVQFIHQSVNDYLLESGLQALDKAINGSVTGRAHFRLSRSCIRYISMKEFVCLENQTYYPWALTSRPELDRRFPFLSYSTRYWIQHVVEVEKHHVPQVDLPQLLSDEFMRRWIEIFEFFGHYDHYQYWPRGTTFLHVAAKHNLLSVLTSVLESDDVDADASDSQGQSPLALTADEGHQAIMRARVAKDNVTVNSNDIIGRTPVHLAAEEGYEAAVKLLLSHEDIDVNVMTRRGWTPLTLAATQGYEAVVKLLLSREDIDVNLKEQEYGETPLALAALTGNKAVVKLLLGRPDVHINATDIVQITPLHLAAVRGYEAVVKLLLSHNDADVNSIDDYEETPLHLAVEEGYEAVVELLLSRDDINVNLKDQGQKTPLAVATEKGNEAIVKLLLSRPDVQVNVTDRFQSTPLYLAARGGHEAVVKLLLSRDDVDVNSIDDWGQTPLHQAAEEGHEAVVELLLSRDDVDVNSRDHDKSFTPLCAAAKTGHENVVELLLARKDVDVNSKDKHGRGPLCLAVERGCTPVVRLLLKRRDVDVNAKDSAGRTPLVLAAEAGYIEGSELLLGHDDIDYCETVLSLTTGVIFMRTFQTQSKTTPKNN